MKGNLPKLLLVIFCFASVASYAQLPMIQPRDTTRKAKKPDYSYLKTYPEFKTNIIGTVDKKQRPNNIVMYGKDKLYSDSFHLINDGAKFELLNEKCPSPNSKTYDRMLVKIISNPPNNDYAGDTGWIQVDYTSLVKYFDRTIWKIDTNLLVNKYTKAATNARLSAAKTKCSANKKCYLAWADYYDCMIKGGSSGPAKPCPLPACAVVDCPEDN